MTTSTSNTESTAATSATTITTATTTSVTNIADEDLCSWAINDYQKKTGVTPANAKITARSEEAREITLTDENGNVLSDTTVVKANTAYTWRFTPADSNYTPLTGSVVLYAVSPGGGFRPAHSNRGDRHTITAIAGANGAISPSGNSTVPTGGDQTFTITPDKGYAVAKVLIDGKSVGAVTSYTFRDVTEAHTIQVIFMKANGNPQTGVLAP